MCLLSALQAHEIGTQLPRQVWIAIAHKAKAPTLVEEEVRLVRFSGAAWTYGIENATFEGVPTRITSPARTVVDCFRFQRLIGREAAVEALKDALQERKVSTDALAGTLKILPSRQLSTIPGDGGAVNRNIAASIRARLLNRARSERCQFPAVPRPLRL